VELLGVFAGPTAVAQDRVLVDAHQPAGLANADALGDVLEQGHRLVFRELGAEQGSALALGEAGLAGAAAEHAAAAGAVAGGDGEVAQTAAAVVGASGVLAAEAAQVVRQRPSLAHGASLLAKCGCFKAAQTLQQQPPSEQ